MAMHGAWINWVVGTAVPEEVRGDYAIVAAEHVRAQEPLLYTGFCFGVPCAILLGENHPFLLHYALPITIMLACVLGALLRRSAPVTEEGAVRALTISTAATGTILMLGSIWAIASWRIAPESVRLGYPFFMTIGVLVTAYAFAKVRRLAAACLMVGMGPLALFLLVEGTLVEKVCGIGIFIAGIFMVVMARNNRLFLVELLEHRQRLHRLSRIDPLTELPNRRALLEDAERMGMRTDTMRLVLLDIDHFKAINDSHGHDMGDQVLCAVARVIASFAHHGVSAARIGGEEFALMGTAEGLSALTGLHLVETLRTADMPHGDRLTVSAGVATGPLKKEGDWRVLYTRADKALYEAKAEGRDRAVGGPEEAALSETKPATRHRTKVA